MEEERHSGLGYFYHFSIGFFPSLWIYLPVVFVIASFEMVSLDILFVDDDVISFCFLVSFYSP